MSQIVEYLCKIRPSEINSDYYILSAVITLDNDVQYGYRLPVRRDADAEAYTKAFDRLRRHLEITIGKLKERGNL